MNVPALILVALGSVGLFLYGMKIMSESLQRFAGGRLRSVLSTMTASPVRGILAGTLITGLIQSSSAVTVMVVGFVNAGLLTLAQSVAMIMGANVGTTVTAWLVAVLGYNVDIGLAAVPVIGLAFPLLFFRREKVRAAGNAIIGFALLMLAINILNGAMGSLTDDPEVMRFISGMGDYGRWAPLFFVFTGIALTVLLQSSSAMIALTIALSGNGLIPLNCAMAMVLGENIGTTATANIAALVTGAEARRAAFCHFLFNLFGTVWALLALPLLMRAVDTAVVAFGGASPLTDAAARPVALALFHSLFNILNVLLLGWFIPQLVSFARRWVRPARDGRSKLVHVDSMLLSTNELSVFQAQTELGRYLGSCRELFVLSGLYFRETNAVAAEALRRKITHLYEENARSRDMIEKFLFRVGEEDVSEGTRRIVYKLFRRAADGDALSEACFAVSDVVRRKRAGNIWFVPQMRERINELFALVGKMLEPIARTDDAVLGGSAGADLPVLQERLEKLIALSRREYSGDEPCEDVRYPAGIVFAELTGCLERLGWIAAKFYEDGNRA